MQIPPHFKQDWAPLAHPEAMINPTPEVRFTILTSRLIRLEYDPAGRFEDRPTQTFWYRAQPVPPFAIERDGDIWRIDTDDLLLTFKGRAGEPFSPENLAIELLAGGAIWRFGDPDQGNLGGTYRTLDDVSGSVPLDPGLMSRAGWTVTDDSQAPVLTADGWIAPRQADPAALDLYFWGYGRDYDGCLQDQGKVAGRPPLLPRWALGNWWSRYWAYNDEELRQLVTDFAAHDIPLSVCIIDMDWHLTETGGVHTGWTGYTWNRALFPDPADFLHWLHEQGLRLALNLHPAEGVGPHEEMYEAMCAALDLDPAHKAVIPFRLSDPTFARAYFEILHHPQEKMGVDFWWIDWQQGDTSELAGLDPLWMLNHLHYYDLGRDGRRRPFIFSRYARLGQHRYPIGFSGDTHVDWPSLAFQPFFTAAAANVGFGWWSHDIGGHMMGIEEPELYLRWVQYGVFSPILRLHSTNNPYHERRPWGFDEDVLELAGEALRLRHALIPYLYTMAWRQTTTQRPLIRPLYHHGEWGDKEEAYGCSQAYLFGSELLAAPFTAPAEPDTGLSRQVIWFPPGEWVDFWTGEAITGDRWEAVYGTLADIPLFAPAGGIVPLEATAGWGSLNSPDELDIHFFAGASRTFTLYEDDGESSAYLEGERVTTEISQQWRENELVLRIEPAAGELDLLPEIRTYRLVLHGVGEAERITARIGAERFEAAADYNEESLTLTFEPIPLPVTAGLAITLQTGQPSLRGRRSRLVEKTRRIIDAFRLDSLAKHRLAAQVERLVEDPAVLAPYLTLLTGSQLRAILETITEAGLHQVDDGQGETTLVAWNNRQNERLILTSSFFNPARWREERFQGRHQPAPRSLVRHQPHGERHHRGRVMPISWRLALDYDGLYTVVLENQGGG